MTTELAPDYGGRDRAREEDSVWAGPLTVTSLTRERRTLLTLSVSPKARAPRRVGMSWPVAAARDPDQPARLATGAARPGTPPNAIYTFRHALVQDASYTSLLRTTRQELQAQRPAPRTKAGNQR